MIFKSKYSIMENVNKGNQNGAANATGNPDKGTIKIKSLTSRSKTAL